MLKVGTLCAGSRMTCNPFFSVASSARGSFTFRTSLLTGALPLTTAPFVVCCPGPVCVPPWPNTMDDTSPIRISTKITLLLVFIILIALTPFLSRCAGCGLRLRLRHGDYNGAIGVDQILLGNTLHVFLGDCFDFVASLGNQVRIVVVNRVLADRDRSQNRALQSVDQVASRRVLGFLEFPVSYRFVL